MIGGKGIIFGGTGYRKQYGETHSVQEAVQIHAIRFHQSKYGHSQAKKNRSQRTCFLKFRFT
jgi:hypothetical protein